MPRASALLLALAAILLANQYSYASYIDPDLTVRCQSQYSVTEEYGTLFVSCQNVRYNRDEDIEITGPDYEEDPADLQLLQDVGKRACIRRGGNCDHRPGDCCHSSSCRCNLWGSNCRCQRMGLFQKWG